MRDEYDFTKGKRGAVIGQGKQSRFGQRFLVVYSGVLTAVFAVTVLSGFVGTTTKKTTLDELTVQRINVVEPDGTLRMVISNKATEPGLIIKSKEHPHPTRSSAGIIFYNDEGTENGGLTFEGKMGKDGQGESAPRMVLARGNDASAGRVVSAVRPVVGPARPIVDAAALAPP